MRIFTIKNGQIGHLSIFDGQMNIDVHFLIKKNFKRKCNI